MNNHHRLCAYKWQRLCRAHSFLRNGWFNTYPDPQATSKQMRRMRKKGRKHKDHSVPHIIRDVK